MNAQLLNPFSIQLPDSVSATLSNAECSVLLFNHGQSALAGQYLALGRTDGYITLWDIETKSVLRLLSGHVRAVTGLAWSHFNRYLASCSIDWNVIIWDLATKTDAPGVTTTSNGTTHEPAHVTPGVVQGVVEQDPRLPFASERKITIRFDCPVTSIQFSPADSRKLIVTLASSQAVLINVQQHFRILRRRLNPASSSCSSSSPTSLLQVEQLSTATIRTQLRNTTIGENGAQEASGIGITAARFTPDSNFIVAGTTKGSLLIFDSGSASLIDEQKVLATSSGVKELSFDAAGRFAVVNCNDRAIRILSVSTTSDPTSSFSNPSHGENDDSNRSFKRRKLGLKLTLLHKISDAINRTPWIQPSFTPSSDHIYSGAAHHASHNVHIYDRVSGTLTKILEGPKDWLVGVDWHPSRPMLASVSNTGVVYIWLTPAEEIWSAYAPGFEELEENVEYEEREGEFDFVEDGARRDKQRQEEEEAAFVRIVDDSVVSSGGARGVDGIGNRRVSQVDVEKVFEMLEIQTNESESSKYCKAFKHIAKNLHRLESDSGWIKLSSQSSHADGEQQTRELVFTLVDDDNNDSFVIPPRLENDYSEFHNDHI
ncbi:related to SWD1 - subunit of the COMPASS complex [Melanopsichium pennsylvanicum]|uniref:Related to SWD1 - subunit of the COMPASS complex n=2 Tax=Melanopsichium pennsylvanicum TaxID=63383 RepID=A0AAJ4XG31_9BASI|nr:related to SWD1-subunit of the COMPASS complex [Melanopsichium pennsylvanicum 4]SNX81483.1 related to SWD1 - subunit of the COMPASS complex [Melanopsichium pennsylvanicum]